MIGLSKLFAENIHTKYRRAHDRLIKMRLSKKSAGALIGQARSRKRPHLLSCEVQILDAQTGTRAEQWLVGVDVKQEIYDAYKDSNGRLHALVLYKNGVPRTSVIHKLIWQDVALQIDVPAVPAARSLLDKAFTVPTARQHRSR